jgi:hypothetical protein
MNDVPVYLLSAWLDRELVYVSIRLSGEPEGRTEKNEVQLDKFRDILIKTFKFTPYDADRQIGEMRAGRSFTPYVSMDEAALYRTGLLTRYGEE